MECQTPVDYCPACGYHLRDCRGHHPDLDYANYRIVVNHNEGRHGLCIDNQGMEEEEERGHGYWEKGDY